MLWASSQVRRLYAIGVAISCRSPQKVSVFTSSSFTTEGERLHKFVVHMLWASSQVRRLYAMGVAISSSTSFRRADACCQKEFNLPYELYPNYDFGVVGSGKPRLPLF